MVLRIIRWTGIIFILLIVILVFALLQPTVQTRIANRLLSELSEDQPVSVQIDAVSIQLSGLIQVKSAKVYDSEGALVMRVQDVVSGLDWWRLLSRRVDLRFLQINQVLLAPTRTLVEEMQNPDMDSPGTGNTGGLRGWELLLHTGSVKDIQISTRAFFPFEPPFTADLSVSGVSADMDAVHAQQFLLEAASSKIQGRGGIEFDDMAIGGEIAADISQAALQSFMPLSAVLPDELGNLSIDLVVSGALPSIRIDQLMFHASGGIDVDFTGWLDTRAMAFNGELAHMQVSAFIPQQVTARGELGISLRNFSFDGRFSFADVPGSAMLSAQAGENPTGTIVPFEIDYEAAVELDDGRLSAETSGEFSLPDSRVSGSILIDPFLPHALGLPTADVTMEAEADYEMSWDSGAEIRATIIEAVANSSNRSQRVSDIEMSAHLTPQNLKFDARAGAAQMHVSANNHLLQYIEAAAADPFKAMEMLPDNAEGELQFSLDEPAAMLISLLPGVKFISPASGSVTIGDGSITGSADLEELEMEGISVEGLQLSGSGESDSLRYSISSQQIHALDYTMFQPGISGTLSPDGLVVDVYAESGSEEVLFRAAVKASGSLDNLQVSLSPAELVLFNQRWRLPDSHQLRIREGTIEPQDMDFSREGMEIRMGSNEQHPLTVEVRGFNTSVIEFQPFENISAIVDADIEVSRLDPVRMRYVISSRDIGVLDREIERFNLSGRVEDVIEAELSMEDGENQLDASAQVSPSLDDIRADISLDHLDIEYLSEFIPEELDEPRGSISGEISIRGSSENPEINGRVQLVDAGFRIARFGTDLRVATEEININQNTIEFASVSLRDPDGRTARINGSVELSMNPQEMQIEMGIRSRGIQLLDTTVQDNPQIYGRLFMDSRLDISGALLQPRVSGSLGITGDSSFTILLPQGGSEAGLGENVVRFRDPERLEPFDQQPPLFSGIEMTTSLSIDPQTEFVLVIDPRRGDRLQMQGGGDLSFGLDAGGEMSLAGSYQIQQGSYQLQFLSFGRRDFQLEPEGTISWTGDPLTADMDMSAVYRVRTSPTPILSDDTADIAFGDLPFEVILDLQGQLQQPEIEFRLGMPDAEQGALGGRPYTAVQNINQHETSRNTQAFALIVLNQFIREDFSGIDETAALGSGTRSSVSELLTYQLNALSNQFIPGVDISFAVDSFVEATPEGSEGSTEVQVEISRQLLSDRLSVQLGGQYDIERNLEEQVDWNDLSRDIAVEYAITPDGRYRLRAFHERSAAQSGHESTTGFSFLFSLDRDPYTDDSAQPEDENE
ncbi:MAG: translocation/assembly module TamB domain-containing protein [Spirochaeta sp.]